jgi:hypothetical protein
MGLEDLLKEGEQAVDGQDAANQVSANQSTGKGNDAMEDTMIDSGMPTPSVSFHLPWSRLYGQYTVGTVGNNDC